MQKEKEEALLDSQLRSLHNDVAMKLYLVATYAQHEFGATGQMCLLTSRPIDVLTKNAPYMRFETHVARIQLTGTQAIRLSRLLDFRQLFGHAWMADVTVRQLEDASLALDIEFTAPARELGG